MWPKGALPRLRRSPFEPPFGAESSAFHIVPGPVFGPASGPVARGFGFEMRPKTAPPSPHFGTESPFATGSKTGPKTGMRPKTGPAIWPKCRAGGSKGPRFRAGSRTSGDFGVTAHRQDVCGAREICHSAAPKKHDPSSAFGGAARDAGPSAAAKCTRAGTRRVWSHSDQAPENS